MEGLFIDVAKNGGPSAVLLAVGLLWINGKLNTQGKQLGEKIDGIDFNLRERCALIHKEVDRRFDEWDGTVERRKK